MTTCPGCGLQSPSLGLDPDRAANASGECRRLMNELSCDTLAHGDPKFIHQHLVDFALASLYLAVDRGFSGRQGPEDAHVDG